MFLEFYLQKNNLCEWYGYLENITFVIDFYEVAGDMYEENKWEKIFRYQY